jgi:hypothetical protein
MDDFDPARIKKNARLHIKLHKAEIATRQPLRYVFLSLVDLATDQGGYFSWHPENLKNLILPYDEHDMSQILNDLHLGNFVSRKVIDNEQWGLVNPIEFH